MRGVPAGQPAQPCACLVDQACSADAVWAEASGWYEFYPSPLPQRAASWAKKYQPQKGAGWVIGGVMRDMRKRSL